MTVTPDSKDARDPNWPTHMSPQEILNMLDLMRCDMHSWKRAVKDEHGVDSWAFRKAYDVEQRLANATHDAGLWVEALRKPPRRGF